MKKHYAFLAISFTLFTFTIISCNKNDDEPYVPIEEEPTVTVDLTKVPYAKLSEYHFFDGDMKNQVPAENVVPYEPASSLFTDYASKKRFVWMPEGTKATYNSDGSVLELPVGAALIKTFYYNNVQNVTPVGGTRIIETRVMIRKADGWIFADYVWNEAQTEAVQDLDGSFTNISWKDENNVVKTADYRIPSEEQCIVCHKSQQTVKGGITTMHIPIGIKPQNLNFNYNYGTETKNQLTKWVELGYLDSNFTLPTDDNSTVDYHDTTKSLDKRVRSYFDANCSHCHMTERHCDYRPMRFAFSETKGNLGNMGVCVNTQDMQGLPPELDKIVTPANINRSMLYYRINTTDETYRMPLHGRTLIHEEGVALVRDWINSLRRCE